MADGLNRVMLLGNLGADPELRFTQSGQAVLNMRLATTESYLDKDKVRRERTDWHNVVIWGKRGEALAKILTKGSSLFIEGSIRTSSYDDREGNKRYKTEIIANNVLLTGRGGRGGASDDAGAPAFEGEYSGPPGPPAGGGGGYAQRGGGGGGAGGGGGGYGQRAGGYNQRPGGEGGGARPARPAAPPAAAAEPPPQDDYAGDYGGGAGGTDDDIPF